MQYLDDGVMQMRKRPFGGYRDNSGGNAITDRGFTGHKHNDDLGLMYMNARFYVSYINRFLSADTIVPDPANPQSYNRYSYTYNNPINYVDPTGHFTEDAISDYVNTNICSNQPTACLQDTLDQWKNSGVWDLLRYAQGGDIAFVGFNDDLFAGGLFFQFSGIGQDSLFGIASTDIYGGIAQADYRYLDLSNINVDDLVNGRNNTYWGGVLRWIEMSNTSENLSQTFPHFEGREGLAISQGDFSLPKLVQQLISAIPPLDTAMRWGGPNADKWWLIGDYNHGFSFKFSYSGLSGPIESADWRFETGQYYYPNAGNDPRSGWLGPIYGFFPQTYSP